MKGGSKVIIERHRHEGVFIAKGGKDDALVTRNLDTGNSVYGEKRISVETTNPAGVTEKVEYRVWNPFRSKLASAIVGGIGSVPGAFLGGLLIAALETGWAAWLPLEGKDVAVFTALIAMLVIRPTGLLGVERTRGD